MEKIRKPGASAKKGGNQSSGSKSRLSGRVGDQIFEAQLSLCPDTRAESDAWLAAFNAPSSRESN